MAIIINIESQETKKSKSNTNKTVGNTETIKIPQYGTKLAYSIVLCSLLLSIVMSSTP